MKTLKLPILCVLAFSLMTTALARESTAWQDANARFQVISDGVIRMEWSDTGKFIDSPSFLAVERKTETSAHYTVEKQSPWILIKTPKMELKYKQGSGRFTADNLIVTAASGVKPFTWRPGDKQKGNLKGTYRTLDGFNGRYKQIGTEMPIEDGLLATDGWTLLDDTSNFLFDKSDFPWVMERGNEDRQDWYLLAYGNDYKSALKDFTLFAGKVPLPPRYAFGYWWSRYWSYSDREIRELIGQFRRYDIPLDVLVIDMDWHHTEPGLGAWTGWTWNTRLFPSPDKLLSYIKEQNLHITLNLHPAGGVAPYESQYPAVAKSLGINPDKGETIPWLSSDKPFMQAVFEHILRPMERMGVDFWWLDWQQWPNDKKIKGLSNTWWLNYVFFTDMERNRQTRPMLYHRWGGLGNHRYQIGFSGDAYITWESLAFQPWFTSCASNVLYGYWSHDLGGHAFMKGQKQILDPELYVRWMQYGAYSPIMRTHSTKSSVLNKEIWNFKGHYFEALRQAILTRYTLVPYIYTMARETWESGVSICRPMYYDYPDAAEAYGHEGQYMFGDRVLVTPVAAPMQNGLSTVKTWLPGGHDWFEWHTGALLKGGQTVERTFTLEEYPVYVKAGSIIPMYERVDNLRGNNEDITIAIMPGGGSDRFELYEDNGNDKQYATRYARTTFTSNRKDNQLQVTIGERKGQYDGMPQTRNYRLKIYGAAPPRTVKIDGSDADFSYSGSELAVIVQLPQHACATAKRVEITFPADAPELNDGIVSQFRRLGKTVSALKFRHDKIILTEELGTMESTPVALEYYPERFNRLISIYRRNYASLPEILKRQKLDDNDITWFTDAVGYTDASPAAGQQQ